MKKVLALGLCVTVGFFAMINLQSATGEDGKDDKKGKRALSVHDMMEELVGPNCKAIGAALKGEPGDKDWTKLARRAAVLNECGHILLADGRCPDGVWAGASKDLQKGTASLIEKLKAKDLEGSREAFPAVTKACGTCHKKHKK